VVAAAMTNSSSHARTIRQADRMDSRW
jgi:hypothetical protein